MLLSTHSMDEATRLCDCVAIIHKGVLQALDMPAALVAQAGAADLEEAFVRIVGEERLRSDLWLKERKPRWYQFWQRERHRRSDDA